MIAQLEGQNITLMTRATPTILAVLPSLEGRRTWLKGGGLRIEHTTHNLEKIKLAYPELEMHGETPGVDQFEPSHYPPAIQPVSFVYKRPPDPHQAIALERCQGKRFFGHLMEQGTGKTKVGIDRSCQLFVSFEITGVLVVTKKGVHRQWVDSELPKDHGPPFKADWWRGKPIDPALLVQGGELKWFSINYDALRGKKAQEAVKQFCMAHASKLHIIADESQHIMNQSIRHNNMLELKPYSNYRTILTGTPISKDLTDEWAQLFWLDETIIGMKYLTTFKAKYCLQTIKGTRVAVTGVQNIEEFRRRVDPFTYRVTKAEIGYLPKHYSEWVFDLTPEQLRLIAQVKRELLAELESGQVVPVSSATAAFTKVQQIANGFIIDENSRPNQLMPVEKNPRIVALLEWLAAYEGKVVIWTRFIADRQYVKEALTKAGIQVAEYAGKDSNRHSAKQSFIEDSAVRVFLANPKSGGTGLDGLQTVCTQAIYYSNSFDALDRWQSEDRIDRRGMIGGAQYTDIIARNSIDRYILRNLKQKKGLSALVLGDIIEAFDDSIF